MVLWSLWALAYLLKNEPIARWRPFPYSAAVGHTGYELLGWGVASLLYIGLTQVSLADPILSMWEVHQPVMMPSLLVDSPPFMGPQNFSYVLNFSLFDLQSLTSNIGLSEFSMLSMFSVLLNQIMNNE